MASGDAFAMTGTDNAASQGLLRGLGFRLEGILREDFIAES